MKILKKLLNNFVIVCILLLLVSCESKNEKIEQKNKIVASVGKIQLTESELNSIISSEVNELKTRRELIKSWIDREVLYKASIEDSIIYSDDYQKIVDLSKKELASALFLRNRMEKFNSDISSSDLGDFYEAHREEFRCTDDTYLMKIAEFTDLKSANHFRKKVFEDGWNSSRMFFSDKGDGVFSESLVAEYYLSPLKLQRIVKNLLDNEVSIIIETEPNTYSVVQLVRKFYKNQIPDLEYVRKDVEKRLLMIEKKRFINELINDLYIKYNVESFKDSL